MGLSKIHFRVTVGQRKIKKNVSVFLTGMEIVGKDLMPLWKMFKSVMADNDTMFCIFSVGRALPLKWPDWVLGVLDTQNHDIIQSCGCLCVCACKWNYPLTGTIPCDECPLTSLSSHVWLTRVDAVLRSLLENIQNQCCRSAPAELRHSSHKVSGGEEPCEQGGLRWRVHLSLKGPSDSGLLWEQGAVRRASWSVSSYWTLSTQQLGVVTGNTLAVSRTDGVRWAPASGSPPVRDSPWPSVTPLSRTLLMAWMTACGYFELALLSLHPSKAEWMVQMWK